MIGLQIFSGDRQLRADFTGRLHPSVGGGGLTFSTNRHGFASLSAPLVPMSLAEAFEVYSWPGLPHVVASDTGAGVAWEGRLEDIEIVEGGVALVALGYQRALYDVPYNGLFSRTGTADWETRANGAESRYEMDNNNRLYIAPRKGEAFGNNNHYGTMFWRAPHGGIRDLTHFSGDYDITLPAGWEANVFSWDFDLTTVTTEWSLTGTGSNQTGSISLTLAADAQAVGWSIHNETGGSYTVTAESGSWYGRLTNLRVKSAATVTAETIARALITHVNFANPAQLAGDGLGVAATATDLRDEVYEDALPADILDRLAILHGTRWAVWEERRLFWGQTGPAARAWYVDVGVPELQRSIENLRNSAYAVYRDADGATRRTAIATNSDARARFGVTRRGVVNVQTTSLTEATTHRDVFLADGARAGLRATVETDRVYDAYGSPWPLWMVRSGDTMTMRNLPPTLGAEIDAVRTFSIGETEYDAETGRLSVSPVEPMPRLDVLLARREAGL